MIEEQGRSPAVPSTRMRFLPEHWTWRDGPVDPGAAVVVDIDGVLSDASTRQHYIEAPRANWRAFFDACGEDPVIEEVRGCSTCSRPSCGSCC